MLCLLLNVEVWFSFSCFLMVQDWERRQKVNKKEKRWTDFHYQGRGFLHLSDQTQCASQAFVVNVHLCLCCLQGCFHFRKKERKSDRERARERTHRFVITFSKTIQISNSRSNDTSKQSNNGAHLSFASLWFCLALPCSGKYKPHSALCCNHPTNILQIHKSVHRITKYLKSSFISHYTAIYASEHAWHADVQG